MGECESASIVCPGKARLQGVLQQYFTKFLGFRPGQLLSPVNGRDVFVRMATGSRKSLCMCLGPLAVGVGYWCST